jgi:hypothetical protein
MRRSYRVPPRPNRTAPVTPKVARPYRKANCAPHQFAAASLRSLQRGILNLFTPQPPFMVLYFIAEIGGCHVELASSHAFYRICPYQRRCLDRRRLGGREWFVQPRISTVAGTAKRVLMVPSRVAMRPPWLLLAGALSTADFRHLISLASPGSLAGGGSGALR